MSPKSIVQGKEIIIPDPPISHLIFSTTKFAWLFFILRIYLGVQWLNAGWHKVTDPVWMSGAPLKGFWTNAITVPEGGSPTITYTWYRSFIEFLLNNEMYTWFAPLVAWGELLVGVALIIGAFTGIAAFFGAFMNWNYIMAGTASTNGFLLAIGIFIMLGWKVAGWYGLDRYLLARIGVPWYHADKVPAPPTPSNK